MSSCARPRSTASASGRASPPAARRAPRSSSSPTAGPSAASLPVASAPRGALLRLQRSAHAAASLASVAQTSPTLDTSRMGAIRTNAAAAMLGVSPNTLRSWERRFGYPEPRRTAGGHRQFDLNEIEALRSAFEETHNISSAVALARQRGAGPSSPSRLRSAFARFDELEADRVLEESLAVRSIERTVDEVLLPAVEALAAERDGDAISPEYGFAWRWASGWLAAARRVAPAAVRDDAVLLFGRQRDLRPRRPPRPGA